MFHAFFVVILMFSPTHALQLSKESSIDNSSIIQFSYCDSHGWPIIEFGEIETNNPVVFSLKEIEIRRLGAEFTTRLMKKVNSNKKTIYYERSLDKIEAYFSEVERYLQGYILTRRISQFRLLIKSCQNIDRAGARFLDEMGGKAWQVEGWKILEKAPGEVVPMPQESP